MSPSDLHFEPTVRQAFNFLSSDLGFERKQSTQVSVLYTSANVRVEILLDPRSYEVGVEVKRRGEDQSFALHRIIELASPVEAERWRLVQTSTPERVREFIPKLANLLKKYGEAALSGDRKVFAELARLEENHAIRTTREFQIREARNLAEHEWQCRNYAKVVSILSPIQEELSASELARLLYAKKRLDARQS
jgi:hypothetical protein